MAQHNLQQNRRRPSEFSRPGSSLRRMAPQERGEPSLEPKRGVPEELQRVATRKHQTVHRRNRGGRREYNALRLRPFQRVQTHREDRAEGLPVYRGRGFAGIEVSQGVIAIFGDLRV